MEAELHNTVVPLASPSKLQGLQVNVGMGHPPRKDQGTGGEHLATVTGYENKHFNTGSSDPFGLYWYSIVFGTVAQR